MIFPASCSYIVDDDIDDDIEDSIEMHQSARSAGAASVITYTRLDEIGVSRSPYRPGKWSWGRRGLLEIKGHSFHTIERLDGYVWLREGDYVVQHHRAKGFIKRKQKYGSLRPNHSQKVYSKKRNKYLTAGILIHSGNWSYQLAGCIAPGLGKSANLKGRGMAVTDSKDAIIKIFELLGGYQQKKTTNLRVSGHMYKK